MKCEPCISIGETQLEEIPQYAPYAKYWELRSDLSPNLVANPDAYTAPLEAALEAIPEGILTYKATPNGNKEEYLKEFHRVFDPLFVLGFNALDIDVYALMELKADITLKYPLHRALGIPISVSLIISCHLQEFDLQSAKTAIIVKGLMMGRLGKVVMPCTDEQQCEAILELQRENEGMLFLGSGSAGQRTRVECVALGAPFSYVHIGHPTAPGQLSLQEYILVTQGQDSNAIAQPSAEA